MDEKDLKGTGGSGEQNKKEYEDVCFICRRPESKAGRMFHLPNNICVCDDCMHKTMDAVSQFDYQGMLSNPEMLNMLNRQFDKNVQTPAAAEKSGDEAEQDGKETQEGDGGQKGLWEGTASPKNRS